MEEYKKSIPEFSNSHRIQRLQSLYSDFTRLRSVNERGYAANLEWWKGVIVGSLDVIAKDASTFKFDDDFVRFWHHQEIGLPRALGVVIESLSDDETLLPLTPFLNAHTNTLPKQSKSLLNMPLEWLFSSLGLGDDESGEDGHKVFEKTKGTYVLTARVSRLAKEIVDEHSIESPTRRLYTRRLFAHKYNLADVDADVVLKWLSNDRTAVVAGEAVKIVPEGKHNAITHVDTGVIGMVGALASVGAQIDELELEISRRNDSIAAHIKNKETDKAKRALRSRKALQELLGKRLDSKENLQGVLLKIEQSVGDIEIMKAYETSNDTLKAILKAPELDRDRVENTMDSLSETLADHGEIEQAIARPGGAEISSEMEDEIENEYKKLFEDSREEEKDKVVEKEKEDTKHTQPTKEIPSPPTTEPVSDRVAETV